MAENLILLTGATGVVGHALLDELGPHRTVALIHRSRLVRPGLRTVVGDITKPRLGLDDALYRELTERVDVVVHSAAETDFLLEDADFELLNVGGLRHVLQFVSDAGAALCHLSTAFVARNPTQRDGTVTGPARYVASKRAAEELVRSSGLPHAIVRPSVVCGDSRTGLITRRQGLHMLIGAGVRNRLPVLPLAEGTHVDMVPQDLVAQCVRALVDKGVPAGEYWVTAGEGALMARRLVEVVYENVDLDFAPPRLVPIDLFDRIIRPVFFDVLPEAYRERLDGLLGIAELFSSQDLFPCNIDEIDPALVPTPAFIEEAFAATVRRYWGRNAVGAEVPA